MWNTDYSKRVFAIAKKYNATFRGGSDETIEFLVPYYDDAKECFDELKNAGFLFDVFQPLSGDMCKALFIVTKSTTNFTNAR